MQGGISKAVLITGCSSGMGEATALRLAGHGWTVYASARRIESIAHLAEAGCRLLQLDVTDEDSIGAAVKTVVDEQGAVGVLVNNAGYTQGGAIEQVPMEAVRRQFETNVFGGIALTQLVLPGMRAQRWGKVVNVGSLGGRVTVPGGGCYYASKHALEAISDALRFEVRGFGVDVTLIEPGLILTPADQKALATIAEASAIGERWVEGDPYRGFNDKLASIVTASYEGPMRHLGGPPDLIAKAVEKTISRRRPRSRMLLPFSARVMLLQRKLLSDRLWDAMLRSQLPEPR